MGHSLLIPAVKGIVALRYILHSKGPINVTGITIMISITTTFITVAINSYMKVCILNY